MCDCTNSSHEHKYLQPAHWAQWLEQLLRSAKGDMHSITHGKCSRKSHDGHRKDSKYCPHLCECCSQVKILVAMETMKLPAEFSQRPGRTFSWLLDPFLEVFSTSCVHQEVLGAFGQISGIQACITLNFVGQYTKMSSIRWTALHPRTSFTLKKLNPKTTRMLRAFALYKRL